MISMKRCAEKCDDESMRFVFTNMLICFSPLLFSCFSKDLEELGITGVSQEKQQQLWERVLAVHQTRVQHIFAPELTEMERKFVHRCAELLELNSLSSGIEDARAVTVRVGNFAPAAQIESVVESSPGNQWPPWDRRLAERVAD